MSNGFTFGESAAPISGESKQSGILRELRAWNESQRGCVCVCHSDCACMCQKCADIILLVVWCGVVLVVVWCLVF